MKVYVCEERDTPPSAVFSTLKEAKKFQFSHEQHSIIAVELDVWPIERKNKYGVTRSKYPHIDFIVEA